MKLNWNLRRGGGGWGLRKKSLLSGGGGMELHIVFFGQYVIIQANLIFPLYYKKMPLRYKYYPISTKWESFLHTP